ncbi:translation initiation factor [Allorhodopirellula solitaria]|uniref:Translation initiation factor Sui1 n=1 Tax=Allorhodopirellula solitaria TaxID=2527987 RepID=A0A5C5XBD3_9BACT|nr:translation initiation factor [Allorhodopirellula solitaria]TWT59212.1 translation initiation factor Sui1 [Allorhodopirellula solitaria]
MSRLFAGTPFDIPPTCDLCEQPEEQCACTPAEKEAAETRRRIASERIAPEKQTATLRTEKRKGGRTATVITGLTTAGNDLPALLSQLQAACGTGGTVKPKDDLIELQGDHTAAARDCLAKIGYRVSG